MSNVEIDLTPGKDGGVLKTIIKEGISDEKPSKGNTVIVDYTGTLESDGSKFDSSLDRGKKFEFELGKGSVIKAWDLCVASMKKGESCRVKCRSDYGYGDSGSPPSIPPKATLIFEIELFDWKLEDLSEDKSGSIQRKILEEGSGYLTPGDDTFVKLNIVGKCGSTVFDDRKDVSFNVGEGLAYDIPEGLEHALKQFKKEEKSRIFLTPKAAFGKAGNEKLKIAPDSSLEYEVTLVNFDRPKEVWQFSDMEKIEQAKIFKERGTKYFKEQRYDLALRLYLKVNSFLKQSEEKATELTEEQLEEKRIIQTAGYLNCSLCYMKLEQYKEAADAALESTKLDPSNAKAFFRLGQNQLSMNEPSAAILSFKKCLEIEPDNTAAAKQLENCKRQQAKQLEKEKNMCSRMFSL